MPVILTNSVSKSWGKRRVKTTARLGGFLNRTSQQSWFGTRGGGSCGFDTSSDEKVEPTTF